MSLCKTKEETMQSANMISCKLPTDRSALSIIGTNRIEQSDVFAPDYWVYDDFGNKKRKWFCSIEGVKLLWRPNLERIARIEGLRFKLAIMATRLWEKEIVPLLREIIESGEVTHTFPTSQPNVFCEYKVQNRNGSPSYNISWVKKCSYNKSSIFGQKLYCLDLKLERFNKRHYKARMVLNEAFVTVIKKYDKTVIRDGQLFRFVVNGREYLYKIIMSEQEIVKFEVVFWPGSTSFEVVNFKF